MNKYDDSSSELSQSTEMNLPGNQSMVLPIDSFRKTSITDA